MREGLRAQAFSVTFQLRGQQVRAVDQADVHLPAGQITALIGESGCGKSVLGMAALGLLPPYARVEGALTLEGVPLPGGLGAPGTGLGLIPQNPSQSLNPARTVQAHLLEALRPLGLGRRGGREYAAQLLRAFGFDRPERVLRAYPHQLSGGMQQRVLCAIGTACAPRWILADEPTKGLDRDLRDQVRDTLMSLEGRGVESMVVITHDLPLAQALCRFQAVMYAGQILEAGADVLSRPLHPYTQAFLNALPQRGFQPMAGVAPRAGDPLPGCPFAPRCPHGTARCACRRPPQLQADTDHMVRCFLYE